MNCIFLGPPGAGKGTLAAKATDILGVPHISSGAVFRAAIAAKNPLGLRVKTIIDSGKLVDDSITIDLIQERLARNDAASGYILDGFPRTIPQAEALAVFSSPELVVNFDISDAVVLDRLTGRRVCKNCGTNYHILFQKPAAEGSCDTCGGELYTRADDNEASIRRRLEEYRAQTAPLIDFYRARGILIDVDARSAVGQVLEEFKAALRVR